MVINNRVVLQWGTLYNYNTLNRINLPIVYTNFINPFCSFVYSTQSYYLYAFKGWELNYIEFYAKTLTGDVINNVPYICWITIGY